MALGLLLPAVHCAMKGIPYSITLVWRDAKNGQGLAILAVATFAIFLAISLFVIAGVIFTRL
jgi:hypothetical protein